MSRTYILQSQQLAVAAGRMKCDANFVGVVSGAEQERYLHDNHVFIEKLWFEGSLSSYRLRCLVHQLRAGDLLLLDSSLSHETLAEAVALAKRAQCVIVFVALTAEALKSEWANAATVRIEMGDHVQFKTGQSCITVQSEHAAAAAAGSLALCLMNGLSLLQSEPFVRAATQSGNLPWYDEVAYRRAE